MKFSSSLLMLLVCTASAGAQETAAPPPISPGSQVIFSRSTEEPVKTPPTTAKTTVEAPASDAERRAITFLSYDLEVHLHPREGAIAVRARMVLRNDADQPLLRLPLQLSSTLSWTNIRVNGAAAVFDEHAVDSDSDHTGTLHEAVIRLPQALASQQSITVDALYEGTVKLSSTRLERIGTPADLAEHSDWDRVSEEFVGLRGFGNVVWYPVASIPVALGDRDSFFAEAAAQRLRQSGAMVTMRVTEEFFGPAPNLAVLDGETMPVTPASLPSSATVPGIAACALPATRLGFATPSLFLLTRADHAGAGLEVFVRPEDDGNAQAYMTAATMVAPLISRWLGTKPKGALPIVDLPEAGDASFENGSVLFTDVHAAKPEDLTGTLIHSLTHAYFRSPYPWLQEGTASFMSTLWLEEQSGRDAAIRQMDNMRGALSLVEPAASDPAEPNAGETLLTAKDPIYYRTKATYVFWMLRDLAGEDALAQAFREYKPEADELGTEFEHVLVHASGKDLRWFFNDWIYHDPGLPDLSIAAVYPNKAGVAGSYIVSVDVANNGTAEVQVPVSVRSNATTVTERLRVPAKSTVTHRFLVQGQPVEVAVNDGTVPEVEASVHRRSLAPQPKAE